MCKSLLALCLASTLAPVAAAHEPLSAADSVRIAQRAEQSMVQVEYRLRYDGGAPPTSGGWITRCPNCGSFHVDSADGALDEQRPVEAAGFVVSPSQVLTQDPLTHPRFIADIAVRFRDQVVPATVASTATTHNALVLNLAEPLKASRPLVFEPQCDAPYFAVTRQCTNGLWTTTVGPLAGKVSSDEIGNSFLAVPSNCLIVDAQGAAVGMSLRDELPIDDSWKGSPLNWPAYPAGGLSAMLSQLRRSCDQSILRVSLAFRSPRREELERHWGFDDDNESAPRRSVLGVAIDPRTVLICCPLSPRVTARLERIVVHPPQAEPVTATFVASLRHYGGFVARLERPLETELRWSADEVRRFRNELLLSADIAVQGQQRTVHVMHQRIASFELGWRRQIYPQLSVDAQNVFLFSVSGDLAALPITRRTLISARWDTPHPRLTPAAYLLKAIGDLEKHSDPNNVPLPEEEESRLAWMGVELQKLDRNLARAHNVAHLTTDGEVGALVSHVYPDSPAMEAGVAPGFVLLRLTIEGQPKPLEIELADYDSLEYGSFPWEELDQIPPEYLQQMPKPWPGVENSFNRALTDLGFGTTYVAEFFFDGRVTGKEMEVARGPTHYDAAPRSVFEALGLAVCDLTYEVRRYFKKERGDPGVIICKIESGGRAAVAGLKPYEIITHVDDTAVHDVKGFEKMLEGRTQLRLAVTRMSRKRIVKIDLR